MKLNLVKFESRRFPVMGEVSLYIRTLPSRYRNGARSYYYIVFVYITFIQPWWLTISLFFLHHFASLLYVYAVAKCHKSTFKKLRMRKLFVKLLELGKSVTKMLIVCCKNDKKCYIFNIRLKRSFC